MPLEDQLRKETQKHHQLCLWAMMHIYMKVFTYLLSLYCWCPWIITLLYQSFCWEQEIFPPMIEAKRWHQQHS